MQGAGCRTTVQYITAVQYHIECGSGTEDRGTIDSEQTVSTNLARVRNLYFHRVVCVCRVPYSFYVNLRYLSCVSVSHGQGLFSCVRFHEHAISGPFQEVFRTNA